MRDKTKGLSSLIKKHPWLKVHAASIEDYIPPHYYERLLKDYIFQGKPDAEHFENYLEWKLSLTENPVQKKS